MKVTYTFNTEDEDRRPPQPNSLEQFIGRNRFSLNLYRHPLPEGELDGKLPRFRYSAVIPEVDIVDGRMTKSASGFGHSLEDAVADLAKTLSDKEIRYRRWNTGSDTFLGMKSYTPTFTSSVDLDIFAVQQRYEAPDLDYLD